jgi:hypothetical protein
LDGQPIQHAFQQFDSQEQVADALVPVFNALSGDRQLIHQHFCCVVFDVHGLSSFWHSIQTPGGLKSRHYFPGGFAIDLVAKKNPSFGEGWVPWV